MKIESLKLIYFSPTGIYTKYGPPAGTHRYVEKGDKKGTVVITEEHGSKN